jgi:hypothetical protein
MFRNGRDWAQKRRDKLIKQANDKETEIINRPGQTDSESA